MDETETEITATSGSGAAPPANALPAAPPGHRLVDPLDLYLEREPGGDGFLIEGDFINFNGQTGEWTIGRDKEPVGATTPFLVHVEGMAIGHVKLVDSKVVARELGLVRDGYERKARAELDDYDKRSWPRDKQGEPIDPWKPTTYLPMRNMEDDRLCVFGPFAPTQLTAIRQFVRIWTGVDRLERRGISLTAIGRALDQDWETSAIALAQLGRRRP